MMIFGFLPQNVKTKAAAVAFSIAWPGFRLKDHRHLTDLAWPGSGG
jgi:hypothetical protein